MNFPIPDYVNFQKFCRETYGSIENLISKAKNGDITAQADLGLAYSEGCGDLIPKDHDKAIGWLSTAVERGCERPFFLGKLGELLDRKGTPVNQRKAYEMYHRAARLGCTTSQLNLAEMYRCGVEGVVNEDLNEAFKWYKKAADEDSFELDSDLGVLERLYAGTMKKIESAVGSSKQRALAFLYKYYLEGECPEGRPQPTKAVYYLTRAAELGDTEAQLKLGQIYLNGSCEQIKDVAKAKRWLGKASASGDIRAKQVQLVYVDLQTIKLTKLFKVLKLTLIFCLRFTLVVPWSSVHAQAGSGLWVVSGGGWQVVGWMGRYKIVDPQSGPPSRPPYPPPQKKK